MNHKEFIEALKDMNISLTAKMVDDFEVYLNELVETNKVTNLTAIKNPEKIRVKHFIDSLSIYKHLQNEISMIDIGSGAGFPGIPIKLVLPDLKVTLIEATKKKCDFLNRVIEKLDLKKIEVINGRAEELAHQGLRANIVVARAVANMKILVELGLPLTKMKGKFIALKGPNYKQELNNIEDLLKILGGRLIDVDEYVLDHNEKRFNLIYEKYKPTDKKYPRRYAEMKRGL